MKCYWKLINGKEFYRVQVGEIKPGLEVVLDFYSSLVFIYILTWNNFKTENTGITGIVYS